MTFRSSIDQDLLPSALKASIDLTQLLTGGAVADLARNKMNVIAFHEQMLNDGVEHWDVLQIPPRALG